MFDRPFSALFSKQLTALALIANCLVKFENFSLGCLGAGFIVQRLKTWFRYSTIQTKQGIAIKTKTHLEGYMMVDSSIHYSLSI